LEPLSNTTSNVVTGEKRVVGPVHVTVNVVIGTDGHVWKAVPENAPTELIRAAASAGAMGSTYQPLVIDGEVVQVATRVNLTIDCRP
jgi:hypothetical protein